MPQISNEINDIFYDGFTPDEIVAFEEQLKRILENCKNAENGRK